MGLLNANACTSLFPFHSTQEYVGLKTLYLEQNALAEIENLEKLVELRCLYLGRNVISQVCSHCIRVF
jgi:Leucine-rich repeat (LRR) protein